MAFYNGSKSIDQQRAKERLNYLIEKEKIFELTEKKKTRSISQNSYLHLILSYWAIDYGETLEYVKLEHFKKLVNPDIFKTERVNRKTGEIREAWKSSAELNTKEMTTAIDRFLIYASKEAGVYLPQPSDLNYIDEIKIIIEDHKQYL